MPSLSDMETMENAPMRLQQPPPEPASDYEGAKCSDNHPLEIISEGYGICHGEAWWHAWAFSQPVEEEEKWPWGPDHIIGADGAEIPAWVAIGEITRERALALIQADMDARRAMPFDEARERARLMPV